MKKLLFVFVYLSVAFGASAQVCISHDNSAPDPSAMLEVKSTGSGILVPRMTIAERDAIPAPAMGLLVFCTDDHQFYVNRGNTLTPNWMPVASITSVAATTPLTSTGGQNPTIALPQAGPSQSGYLSETHWNLFNNKQNALTFGNLTSGDITVTGGTGALLGSGAALTVKKANLTETGSSVLTITNGSNAVLGELGTTVQVKQAGSLQSGYLTSNDWNSFNSKVSSQWVSNAQDISYNVGKVGVGTSSPAPSAIVEMSTTTAGVLIPRMTLDQRNAIVAPAEGLMVFCLDCGTKGSLSIYSGGSWNTFSPCTSPSPVAAFHSLSPGKIVWNWLAAPGSLGFKWGTTPSYTQAIDMGSLTSKTETGVECDATYNRYLWTYNACGVSDPIVLSQAISSATPDAPTVGTHTATQTSITWNWNFVPGATGYKWSTVNDFATAIDKGNSNSHNETGDTCATEYTRFVWAYNGCGYSTVDTLTMTTLPCWACGISTLTINHVTSSGVAPVEKTTSYGTVTGIPGEPTKCWITSNLGADHQATSESDPTEASGGWYWQFNRKQGYKYDGSRVPNTTWTFNNENSDWLPSNDPCALELGSAWRLPTVTEWTNVDASGNWYSWDGPWNSGLKLHMAGHLYYGDGGGLHYRGSEARYASSSQANATYYYVLHFGSGFCNMSTVSDFGTKSDGHPVRCLNDNSATPPTAPDQSSHAPSSNQIIWNWTSVSGATGYKWNTTNDYASATDMGTSTSKTETGLNCNTPYTRYAWAYNDCGASSPVTLSQSTLACGGGFTCGQSLPINHVAGDVAPVSKNTTYGTVTGIPGEPTKCWITSNLGSDHQAITVDDATEPSAGWYWQFNRKQGYKHDGSTLTPAWTITNISENSDWIPANDPCKIILGTEWHVPTSTEWQNVRNGGNWTSVNGPWSSGLKIHQAGHIMANDGSIQQRGGNGVQWSSTQGSNEGGWKLIFDCCNMYFDQGLKAEGFTLRCLRE